MFEGGLAITSKKSSTKKRTPESIASGLRERWKAPTPERCESLGGAVWRDMLDTPFATLFPRDVRGEFMDALLSSGVARTFWSALPPEMLVTHLQELRDSGLTLKEAIGPEAADLLKEGLKHASPPDRELLEDLLDQPALRRALRNLIQKSMQQFLSQINPLGGDKDGRGPARILGTIGRGFAQRAERAAQIGRTFMEGFGGNLYRQVESQLQPFLSGFMNRSVRQLTEILFEGEEARKLGQDARARILETLLESPLSRLLPEPDRERIAHRLKVQAAIGAHLGGIDTWRARTREALETAWMHVEEHGTLRQVLEFLDLPLEPPPAFLRALGERAFEYLGGDAMHRFLLDELQAVW